jgi:antitoxin ParD1/3/4
MHTHDDLQKQRIDQLNQAIETGLTQLKSGHKIPSSESYQRLKKKIEEVAKDCK